MSVDYPPFSGPLLKNYGALVDLSNQVLAQAGFESSTIFMPWARAINWCRNEKIDGIIGIWHTVEREQLGYFSLPLIANQMVFYRNKKSDIHFDSFATLAEQGLTVGMVRGYVLVDGLAESGVELYQVANDAQNFRMLARGRVDLITVDRDYARSLLLTPEFAPFKSHVEAMPQVLHTEQQYVLFCGKNHRSSALVERYNKKLSEFRQDGRFQQIKSKHGLE
ncbi:transporter substrate-binding domain-containing protein [Endozoicomonas sp. G2_1]|uniref:substrate-binding periplasmic protein n=1 Tax=Endozoicomonas sp. G2_1 TaxID=2821091 RepID=UPI001ADD249F|nr:transporter substrate-binding domain-containing protein [Endozoicomonas sp. G2_1]